MDGRLTVYEADWVCPATVAPIRDGAIAVEAGVITSVGPRAAVRGEPRVRFAGAAIIPGFVNAHTHLELTLFHGLLDGLTFHDWIWKLVRIKYGSLDDDAIRASARLGAIQMLQAGVTTVGEVMETGAGWEAMREFGLQGIAYQEVFGPDEAMLAQSMKGLQLKVAGYRSQETQTRRVGVSPHAPYTVSKPLYAAVRDFARSEGLRMTAHVAESNDETLFVRDGVGPFAEAHARRNIPVVARECLPVSYLDSLEMLTPEMLLIHVIETDARDLRRIREGGSFVVHCPRSNATLGHRIAPVAQMKAQGISVALGTDSLASNPAIDMFEEMRLTARQQSLSSDEVFRMATIDGARALGLHSFLGSLDLGKRADFVVVDLQHSVEDPVTFFTSNAMNPHINAVYSGGVAVSVDRSVVEKEVQRIRETIAGL